MKQISRLMGFLLAIGITGGISKESYAAQGSDPEWPCIQRKVPELTLAQIWTGPDLPEAAKEWQGNGDLVDLIRNLSARRLPLAEASDDIEKFAERIDPEARYQQLSKLIMGLFDHMNHERSLVISGIARYAKGQNSMAELLRKEAAELDKMREDKEANVNLVDQRQERLLFMMRVFQERAQSLTFVCEVPTLVEQRLFALVKSIEKHFPK